jgi:uncharacterized CHY-type Zn-finger protein
MFEVFGHEVFGVEVDSETRCAHYNSELDIIAIKFACCDRWFPCFLCHQEVADHPVDVWPRDARDSQAVLCGGCGRELTINEYFACDSACPSCARSFNPGCANHYHLYFEA